jgi:hypothetical protein
MTPQVNWIHEPDYDDQDTREIWPISLHMESRMVTMIDRDGNEKSPVIRGSFVHRLWKSNGYTEKKS